MSNKESQDTALSLAKLARAAALDIKANDVVILDVKKLTSYTDYFVICSAPSERQVKAIVKNVENTLRKDGHLPFGIEGLEQGAWVLADFGDMIFHCFLDSARSYYDLEGFWIDAKQIEE